MDDQCPNFPNWSVQPEVKVEGKRLTQNFAPSQKSSSESHMQLEVSFINKYKYKPLYTAQ